MKGQGKLDAHSDILQKVLFLKGKLGIESIPSERQEILKREIFQKMTIQKREHFRIEYPTEERAILLLNNVQFDVIDLSQSGIRFQSPDHLPQLGQIFVIKLAMLHGYQHTTRAKVVRGCLEYSASSLIVWSSSDVGAINVL